MAGDQILLVEDNERNMKLLRDLLQAVGHATLEATSGAQALMLAVEQRPALILMDLRLPDIDGPSVVRRLRRDERTAAIPVVAVTAQAMTGEREWLLAAGFDDYLSKPVDLDALLAIVERHLGRGEPGRT
jgi:two-component system cell cycle response regulator DivK